MFASDRDLLIFEPALPREVDWAGQRLLDNAVGTLSGGIALALTTPASIAGMGLERGQLIRVSSVWGEIVEVVSSNLLAVSKLRTEPAGTPLPLASDGAGLTGIRVLTYAPQRAVVHRQLIESLRLEADGIGVEAVLNPRSVARVEALGTLHLLYAGAAAMAGGPAGDALSQKAQMYEQRYQEQRATLVVRLDTDGDGQQDQTRMVAGERRSNTQRLTRG
jgi:hypothetical protein